MKKNKKKALDKLSEMYVDPDVDYYENIMKRRREGAKRAIASRYEDFDEMLDVKDKVEDLAIELEKKKKKKKKK